MTMRATFQLKMSSSLSSRVISVGRLRWGNSRRGWGRTSTFTHFSWARALYSFIRIRSAIVVLVRCCGALADGEESRVVLRFGSWKVTLGDLRGSAGPKYQSVPIVCMTQQSSRPRQMIVGIRRGYKAFEEATMPLCRVC